MTAKQPKIGSSAAPPASPRSIRRRSMTMQTWPPAPRHTIASSAMPLWRRSHDHRRDPRAQLRTPSPAIAQSRAQDRDAMTPITAFVALPARREPRFRCRIAAMLAGIL